MDQSPIQKVPNRSAPKLPGAALFGRMMASEALLLVLMEAYLDRSDVSEEQGKKLLQNMRESAKALAAQHERPEVAAETDKAIDKLLDLLTKNMPAMKGEFGVATAPESSAPAGAPINSPDDNQGN